MIYGKEVVLVHVAEIFLKSPYVKRHFQKVLQSRIADKLNRLSVSFKIHGWQHNALLISGHFCEQDLKTIAHTYGVSCLTPAILTESNFASIRKAFSEIRSQWKDDIPTSYRITARKDKQLSLSHYSVEYEGSYYFEDWKVDLKKPDLNIVVDVKSDRTAIYYKKIEGLGGFPYGTQGKVLVLASKGIDSPVSAHLIAKRGCEIVLLHFGEHSLSGLQSTLEGYAGKSIKTITLPHIPLLKEYQRNYDPKYQCIFCKLSMVVIANRIASLIHAKAIVMGDNLGQVATQTLDNLSLVESLSDLPLLRPLIGMDKQEIIQLSKKANLFQWFENTDCAFVPPTPATTMQYRNFQQWLETIQFYQMIDRYWQMYWLHAKQEK